MTKIEMTKTDIFFTYMHGFATGMLLWALVWG